MCTPKSRFPVDISQNLRSGSRDVVVAVVIVVGARRRQAPRDLRVTSYGDGDDDDHYGDWTWGPSVAAGSKLSSRGSQPRRSLQGSIHHRLGRTLPQSPHLPISSAQSHQAFLHQFPLPATHLPGMVNLTPSFSSSSACCRSFRKVPAFSSLAHKSGVLRGGIFCAPGRNFSLVALRFRCGEQRSSGEVRGWIARNDARLLFSVMWFLEARLSKFRPKPSATLDSPFTACSHLLGRTCNGGVRERASGLIDRFRLERKRARCDRFGGAGDSYRLCELRLGIWTGCTLSVESSAPLIMNSCFATVD